MDAEAEVEVEVELEVEVVRRGGRWAFLVLPWALALCERWMSASAAAQSETHSWISSSLSRAGEAVGTEGVRIGCELSGCWLWR